MAMMVMMIMMGMMMMLRLMMMLAMQVYQKVGHPARRKHWFSHVTEKVGRR